VATIETEPARNPLRSCAASSFRIASRPGVSARIMFADAEGPSAAGTVKGPIERR